MKKEHIGSDFDDFLREEQGMAMSDSVRANVRRWLEETDDDPHPVAPEDWTVEHWQLLVAEHPDMRYWVTFQTNAPEAIVRLLLTFDDWRVRTQIARRRNLPPDLFPVLAADPDTTLRQAIACNAKTPIELVEQLTEDPEEIVARVAIYNLRERRAELDKKRGKKERAAALQAKRPTGTEEVEAFLAALDHPFKPEILAARQILLGAAPGISEGIKWNAPSFRTSEDFATFHLRAKDGVQVILHPGAKRRDVTITIADPASLLQWLAKDRASVKFRDLSDVEAKRPAFEDVIRQWIAQVG